MLGSEALRIHRFICSYPTEDRQESKKNGPDDVGLGKVEHVVRLAPGVGHVDEGDGVEEGPQSGEGHVQDDVVLPRLDGRHLLKEPDEVNR